MTMTNFEKSIIKYTVKTNNLSNGTITAVELPEIKVGEFHRNVQFVDDCGNKMGKGGFIEEILKIEEVNY